MALINLSDCSENFVFALLLLNVIKIGDSFLRKKIFYFCFTNYFKNTLKMVFLKSK